MSVDSVVDSSIFAFSAGFLEPLQRHRVLGEVDALVALELGHEPVDHALVEVVATQVRVAVGGLDLELAEPSTSYSSRTEMSYVPPPRSKTATFSSFFLSRP